MLSVGTRWRACTSDKGVSTAHSVNITIVKPRLAAVTSDIRFSGRKILRSIAYMTAEKAIRFRHPDYNLDHVQKLISSSTYQHLLTCNISSKSMHTFMSNLADRQWDRQTDRQTGKCRQMHLPPPLSEVTTTLTAFHALVQPRRRTFHRAGWVEFTKLEANV